MKFLVILLVLTLAVVNGDNCPESRQARIVKPCTRNVLNCIRNFFLYSDPTCVAPRALPLKDTLVLSNVFVPLHSANTQIQHETLTVENLKSAKIESFQIDVRNNLTYLTFSFKDLKMTAPSKVTHYIIGHEPKTVLTDISIITSFNLTTIFYGAPKINIKNSGTVSQFIDPIIDYGCLETSNEPALQIVMEDIINNFEAVTREHAGAIAPLMGRYFLKTFFCS